VSFDFSAFRDTSPISDEVFTLYDNLRILPIPNEYDTPNVISVMEVLIINPATKHTEEMLALAEHMMTEAMNPVRDSWTDPQLSTMFFKDKSVYQNVYNKDSEQFDDLYRFYSNCYVPIIPTDLYSYINELAFGNATIDETVFAIDRYMKMRWRESQ
jgi:virulence-associated protein VagC